MGKLAVSGKSESELDVKYQRIIVNYLQGDKGLMIMQEIETEAFRGEMS